MRKPYLASLVEGGPFFAFKQNLELMAGGRCSMSLEACLNLGSFPVLHHMRSMVEAWQGRRPP